MWKDYKETFDGVHASQRLKTEVLNMKREEKVTGKRRIPAAALAAAILVFVLAGTAVAEEIINRVNVDLVNPDEAGVSTEGYSLRIRFSPIPLESLSEEALERFAYGEGDGSIATKGRPTESPGSATPGRKRRLSWGWTLEGIRCWN